MQDGGCSWSDDQTMNFQEKNLKYISDVTLNIKYTISKLYYNIHIITLKNYYVKINSGKFKYMYHICNKRLYCVLLYSRIFQFPVSREAKRTSS